MDHHIVPQFLLRQWCKQDREKKLHGFLYRDGRLSRLRLTPRGTSYKPDLYAFSRDEVAGNARQAVETQVLQRIDTDAARVRDKLDRNEVLSRDDMMAWTRFLISLRTRQPGVIDKLRVGASAHFRSGLAERPEEFHAVSKGAAPSLEAWMETALPGLIDDFGLFIFGDIANYPPIADQIVRLKWATRHFPDAGHSLLLADNPEFVGATLGSAEFVITVPIAPDRVFIAVHDDGALDQIARTPDAFLISKLNEQAVRLASEKLYAKDWAAERFIQNRLGIFGETNEIPMPDLTG